VSAIGLTDTTPTAKKLADITECRRDDISDMSATDKNVCRLRGLADRHICRLCQPSRCCAPCSPSAPCRCCAACLRAAPCRCHATRCQAANTATRRRPSGLRQRIRHPPFFTLSPPTEMDSIASPPTPPSVDGTSHAIACSLSLSPVVCRHFSMLRILLKGGGDGALAHWRGNDSVRVLASARCCWRRGGM